MIKSLALAALAFASALPAHADAVFTTGNHHQPNEENILFNTAETGMTIAAHTNRSHTGVQFTSTTDILEAKGGQSDIDAADGELNNITFTVPGHTFNDFILNPFKPAAAGDLMVTAVTNTGTFTFMYGDVHGNNFLTITTTGGEVLDSVTVDSVSGFLDFKQPRVSGISGVTLVPEAPAASLMLLGGSLLGLVHKRRS